MKNAIGVDANFSEEELRTLRAKLSEDGFIEDYA